MIEKLEYRWHYAEEPPLYLRALYASLETLRVSLNTVCRAVGYKHKESTAFRAKEDEENN